MSLSSRLYLLTPLIAVATLPLGILAGLFYGPLPAAVVFVVGWLLFVPVTAILFGGAMMTGPMTNEFEEVTDQELQAVLDGEGGSGEPTDPVQVLRERYARGEIGDAELERGLAALLETEGIDGDDTEEIERTIERLDEIDHPGELQTERT